MPRLTIGQKRRYIKLIVQRDGGFKCFYCDKQLTQQTGKFEHLNDNWRDSRPDNLVLACQSCNVKKISDTEMQDAAIEKLEKNESGLFVGENFSILNEDEKEENGTSTEIQINERNYDLVEQYLTDQIQKMGSILYNDTLDSCVYLCKTGTRHGSHNSVRGYLDTLTSSVAPYEKTGNGKDKKIVKRYNNTPAAA